jgi:hypothetical protein
MAPAKNKGGGNMPDQLLSKKEIRKLQDKIPTFAVHESAKKAYMKAFDAPKRKHATELCDQGIVAWREQNAAHSAEESSSSQVQGQPTAEGSSTSVSASDELLSEDAAQDDVQDPIFDQYPTATQGSTISNDDLIVPTSSTTMTSAGNQESSGFTDIRSVKLVEDGVQLTMPMGNKSQHPQGLIAHLGQIDVRDTGYPIRQQLRATPTSEVLTNHFEISIDPKSELFEYQIIGIPADCTTRQKQPIVNTILQSVPFLRDNAAYIATDYNETIVAWKNLNNLTPYSYVNAGSSHSLDGREWKILDIENDHDPLQITLRFRRMVDLASLQRYVTSDPTLSAWNSSAVCNVLNIVISKCFDSDVV